MKKLFTLAAVLLCGLTATAQTELLNLPKSAAEAEAAGYGQMWNTYDWGALVPAGTVAYSDDNVKLTIEAQTYLAYGSGNIKKAGKNIYDKALCMSSNNVSNFVNDPILTPADVANTSSGKQGGVLTLEPTVDGKVSIYYSSGFNNRSMFVFDVTSTLNEGYGAVILANNIEQGGDKGDQMKNDGVKDKVHVATFDVVGGHKYHIVGSGTQQELYSVTFTSFLTDAYTPNVPDAASVDAFLLNLPKSAAEAEAAGYGQMWNTYDWGALVPAGTVAYSDDNVKLTIEAQTYLAYGSGNIKKAGKNIYDKALCMSSNNVSNFVNDPILTPADVANTSSGKQGGVLTLEPTVDGKVSIYYSSGFNNRSMFVFDVTSTLNEGYGAVILANNIEQGGDKGDNMKANGVTDKVHVATFDVVGGHKYHIVGSGSQQELYQVTWTSFLTDKYTTATGIEEVLTNNGNNNGENTIKAIYTIDGSKVNSLQKGLNIIKYSDGTAKKVIK